MRQEESADVDSEDVDGVDLIEARLSGLTLLGPLQVALLRGLEEDSQNLLGELLPKLLKDKPFGRALKKVVGMDPDMEYRIESTDPLFHRLRNAVTTAFDRAAKLHNAGRAANSPLSDSFQIVWDATGVFKIPRQPASKDSRDAYVDYQHALRGTNR